MSPERLRGEGTTPADDIYAFAMMIYALWTDCDPFYHLSLSEFYDILESVGDEPHLRPSFPPDVPAMPDELSDLMKDCWKPEPHDRPNIDEVVQRLDRISSSQVHLTTESSSVEDSVIARMEGLSATDLFEAAQAFHHGKDSQKQDLNRAFQLYARAAALSHPASQHEFAFFRDRRNAKGLVRSCALVFACCKFRVAHFGI
ncbi:hypothetical protein M427DRAFT_364895 [Gonapodya prolifera JEL478]|uniref:Protein kinase domain-containing protein n=1 Tax=Gonapodya prolifera (strain JEL478) TaxID=1344416 RepID=A0A139A9X3_GONPJ|nr:hypothetical protein M427DRAFT_364895 [Gonapodya prolifera JEL478]|eukprot:KXS13601.1 hypothetical protein M427DRAFT_364895 [Gonapodya prolifera JEL478]